MSNADVLVIAGEHSGDTIAAELVRELSKRSECLGWRFFGAGGAAMRSAGVDVLHDLTSISVIGPMDAAMRYFTFRNVFNRLLQEAAERRPSLVILIDFSHFNHKFAHAIRQLQPSIPGWNPRITKVVSPQVWASRPGRARTMEQDLDLLLCIFPFEPGWYATHAPKLRTCFVGHPLMDRYQRRSSDATPEHGHEGNRCVLLPGSREQEIRRHLPVMAEVARHVSSQIACEWVLVVPDQRLMPLARRLAGGGIRLQVGSLSEALRCASMAIASTGSVTLECAYFETPTLAMYKTSWLTYWIARRIITVKYLAMPNILADEEIMPEFIQGDASVEKISSHALKLMQDPARRSRMRAQLRAVVDGLGQGGAAIRSADAILGMLKA
ncbi:MAG: lipid-A-disaccharide synthase [Verrucomicrobia bacterium]|nr:lipid-A-disaccharide synthase [Verrucomicrobiota bacterium]